MVSVGERIPLNVRVDEEVRDAFREFTHDKRGKIRGEMGRLVENAMVEYMDEDRYTRIEEGQTELLDLLRDEVLPRLPDEELHTHTKHFADLEDLEPQVRKGVAATLDSLPEGEVLPSDVKQAVYSAGRTDDRTVRKYREILEARGILLPDPRRPEREDAWIHGATRFALICETNDEVGSEYLDALLGRLEGDGRFSTKAYRDALPDDFAEGRPLKIDEVRAGGPGDPGESEGEA